MSERLRAFFDELQRRKVYHVAAAYVVVGLGILGAAEVILEPLGLDAARPYVVILVLLGFPIALILGWAYELRPESKPPPPPSLESGNSSGSLPPNRIAVLPFASIHPDREHDYFADGVTEELISAISKIHGLDVIARTSVIGYKDSNARIGEIARDLNVGVILEGSVRKAGDDLRVTVQLINAETEGHLWAEDYDREFREIFSVQRDIASHVAEALRLQLLTPDAERIGNAPTEDLEAFDLYLLGRHYLNRRADAGTRKAISAFERAIELDPAFAAAFAGLADAYLLAALGYMSPPPENVLALAREKARYAIQLDESLSEAHTSLGYSGLLSWDLRTAESGLRRAIELNPSYAQAHQWMAQVHIWLDRAEEGIREYERALELDPLSAVLTLELGWGYHYAWDFERALFYADQALEMDPNLAIAHYNRGDNLQRLGRSEEALTAYSRALELSPDHWIMHAFLGSAHAQNGSKEEAQEILAMLEKVDSTSNPIRTFIAVVQEALGQKEEALASIRIAIDRREPMGSVIPMAWLPFHSLRSMPEFQSIVEEINGIIGR